MKTSVSRWCWRQDLAAFRGLSDQDRSGFFILLEWMENFRLRFSLDAGREATERFWKVEVMGKGQERERWQLEQWARALAWYLQWFKGASGTSRRCCLDTLILRGFASRA